MAVSCARAAQPASPTFPALRVGNVSDARLNWGVTASTAERPFVAAVDIAVAAPGTRETDLLRAGAARAGRSTRSCSRAGSVFGTWRRRRGSSTGCAGSAAASGRGPAPGLIVPIVPAAILFDLANGGDKAWEGAPLIRVSGPRRSRRRRRTSGSVSEGAGTGAMTATVMGGLGSASLVTENGTTVGALAAVNAFGGVCPPGSRRLLGGGLRDRRRVRRARAGRRRRRRPSPSRALKPGPAEPTAKHDDRHRRDRRRARQGGRPAARRGGAYGHGAGDRGRRTPPSTAISSSRWRRGSGRWAGAIEEAGLGNAAALCLARGDRPRCPCGAAHGGKSAAVLARPRRRDFRHFLKPRCARHCFSRCRGCAMVRAQRSSGRISGMAVEKVEALVIGAGQAGVAMSEHLSRAGGCRTSSSSATASPNAGGPGGGTLLVANGAGVARPLSRASPPFDGDPE